LYELITVAGDSVHLLCVYTAVHVRLVV